MTASVHDDDAGLMKLLLRLSRAHIERAEEGLEDLRGKDRGEFISDRRDELQMVRQRLAKAERARANETTLDCAHNMMREIERIHDVILAAVSGHEAELERWLRTAGMADEITSTA